MSDSFLFDSPFKITDYDQSKYDRVARVTGIHEDMKFTLDVNIEIYPIAKDDNVQLALTTTLALDGTIGSKEAEAAKGGWRENRTGEASVADSYDYVCYGKMYRFEEGSAELIKVYVSFGGLLLYLEGPIRKLRGLKHDYVYLLLKK